MTQHAKLTIARVCQHLLRYPSRLHHRKLQKALAAAWEAGREYERRSNGCPG